MYLRRINPADGPWSGSIQCQLDVEQPGYSRHEAQTWTLTGDVPTVQGAMRVVSGHLDSEGTRRSATSSRTPGSSTLSGPPTFHPPARRSPCSFALRMKDFIIRQWHSLQALHSGVAGTRQAILNGTPAQPSPVSFAASEWQLPWIETDPDGNLSGKFPVQADNLGGDLAQGGPPATALCRWKFARGNPSKENPDQNTAAAPAPDGTRTTWSMRPLLLSNRT